jgi:hypothetical protein
LDVGDGSIATLSVIGWRGSYCPNSGHSIAMRQGPLRATFGLTHRNKDSLPFRRRATVKSVTDLPIEA